MHAHGMPHACTHRLSVLRGQRRLDSRGMLSAGLPLPHDAGSVAEYQWPSRARPLREIEQLLHCPICASTFDTAVSPPCGHTFCSMCILQALDVHPWCPSCRKGCRAGDLRPNRPLEIIARNFEAVKPELVSLFQLRESVLAKQAAASQRVVQHAATPVAQASVVPAPGGAVAAVVTSPLPTHATPPVPRRELATAYGQRVCRKCGLNDHMRCTKRLCPAHPMYTGTKKPAEGSWASQQTPRQPPPASQSPSPVATPTPTAGSAAHTVQDNVITIDDDDDAGKAASGPPAHASTPPAEVGAEGTAGPVMRGHVACPVCSRSVPAKYVNMHLDKCLSGGTPRDTPSQPPPASSASTPASSVPAVAAAAIAVSTAAPVPGVVSSASSRATRAVARRAAATIAAGQHAPSPGPPRIGTAARVEVPPPPPAAALPATDAPVAVSASLALAANTAVDGTGRLQGAMKTPVYSMLKDAQLRRILQGLGLPTRGNSSALKWRHKHYVMLHNTNLRALYRRSPRELVSQLIQDEAAHVREARAAGQVATQATARRVAGAGPDGSRPVLITPDMQARFREMGREMRARMSKYVAPCVGVWACGCVNVRGCRWVGDKRAGVSSRRVAHAAVACVTGSAAHGSVWKGAKRGPSAALRGKHARLLQPLRHPPLHRCPPHHRHRVG